MEKWICLILGSVAGGSARYVLAGQVYRRWGTDFPYGTLVVNLSGCLLIGILNGLAQEKLLLSANARILLMTGFCGAFTTFSALILETSNLMKGDELLRALANVGISLVLGFILFRLGALLVHLI